MSIRLFQNSGIARGYIPRMRRLSQGANDFAALIDRFLADRYGTLHFLKPVLDRAQDAFFTNGDDEVAQRAWARENGLQKQVDLDEILLAQIESHRTEVLYNLDPVRYGSAFLQRLPGSVKRTIAWRAAPSGRADFGAYDLLVCNFPSLLEDYRAKGWRADYFFPAHDPEMEAYAANDDRPIDILFVGGYSRHHSNRVALLEAVARMRETHSVVYHLERSRLTTLAETPLGWVGPMARHRRPAEIRAVCRPAIFGRELYAALSRAKIVLNGAVDMAGRDRGNMRCWEATGCGAMLVSDEGDYPAGFENKVNMRNYSSSEDAVAIIKNAFAEPEKLKRIVSAGNLMVKQRYSKERQWDAFQALL